MSKPLSTAQLRVLQLAESHPEYQHNGRIRRTAEILEKRGLITYDWRPYLRSGFDKVGQVWSIHITDGGREWLAKARCRRCQVNRITAGPITLHLDPDEEPYNEYPKVGIVARATLRVNTGTGAYPHVHEIPLRSGGVWGIEDEDLVAGCPIPDGSWVIGDYGNDQTTELQDLIDTLITPGGAK